MKKYITSIGEYERRYYPKSLLDRLQRTVCDNMLFKDSSISKFKDNSLTGILRFAKPNYNLRPRLLSEIVQEFYRNEGFEVLEKNNNSLEVKRNSKRYSIIMARADDFFKNYMILIDEHPFKALH